MELSSSSSTHSPAPPPAPLSGQQDNQPAVHQVIFFPNCDTEQNPDQRCPKEKKNIAGLITIIIIIKILNIITLLIVKGEDDDLWQNIGGARTQIDPPAGLCCCLVTKLSNDGRLQLLGNFASINMRLELSFGSPGKGIQYIHTHSTRLYFVYKKTLKVCLF